MSKAIKDFLTRKGITPTGNDKKDLELAKQHLPKSWKERHNEKDKSFEK